MNATPDRTRELSALGWTVASPKAKRPATVPERHVLAIGEDVFLLGHVDSPLIIELDDAR